MTKKITLGFSPCPNDTFIFDALVNKRIDTKGIEFETIIEDVEELNRRALKGELDITKLSFFTYLQVINEYVLLNGGSALGSNCGPLLISKKPYRLNDISQRKVAIPGRHTTANFLLSVALPELKDKTEVLFSEIENKVLRGEFDAGLIIHENRFTYEKKGLKKVIDLGEYWQNLTDCPIPLGGIAVKRNCDDVVTRKLDGLINESVNYAFENPEVSKEFIKKHAQEMDEDVTQKHIGLYVNEYTKELGAKGRAAIETMVTIAVEKKIIPEVRGVELFLQS